MSLAQLFTKPAPPSLEEAERSWRHAETELAQLEQRYADSPTSATWAAIEAARSVVDKTQLVLSGAQERERLAAEKAQQRRREAALAEVERLAAPLEAQAMKEKLWPVRDRLITNIRAIIDDLEAIERAERGYSVATVELQVAAKRAGVEAPRSTYRSIGSFARRVEDGGIEHTAWRDQHTSSPILADVIAAGRAELNARQLHASTAYALRSFLGTLAG